MVSCEAPPLSGYFDAERQRFAREAEAPPSQLCTREQGCSLPPSTPEKLLAGFAPHSFDALDTG
jgi:hypothetical protein